MFKLPIIQVNLLHPPTSVNCHQDIINDSGADVLMEQKASEEKRYVTMEEQETMKKELKEELRKELLDETRAEVVRLLGQYAAGSHWGSREN